MAVVIDLVGQRLGKGQNASGTCRYQVQGTEDKILAYSLVHAASPAVWANLVKQNVDIDEIGGGVWDGRVKYGVMEAGNEGDVTWSFEVGSQSIHVTQAAEHIETYVASGNKPDHQGTIGVRRDGSGQTAEGCDILIPTFHWEETYYVAYETVATHAFINGLEAAVGKINNNSFRIWAKGELLLLSVSGAKRGEEPVGLTYRFASSRTKTNFTIGDVTGITKEGHHYLWIEYQEKEQGTTELVLPAKAVHVERVYDYASFSGLGLPDPWA